LSNKPDGIDVKDEQPLNIDNILELAVVVSNKPDGIAVISVFRNAPATSVGVQLSNKPDGIDVKEEEIKTLLKSLLPVQLSNKSDGILNKDEVSLMAELKLQLAEVLNTPEPIDDNEEQPTKEAEKSVTAILSWNKLSGIDVKVEQFWKTLWKLVTEVASSNSPEVILVKLLQSRKHSLNVLTFLRG